MEHEIHAVQAFEIVGPCTLRIEFEDGAEQTINFEPVLAGEIFGPLRDLSIFEPVQIDGEVETLVCRTAPTSIRRLCTTGRSTNQRYARWRSVGLRPSG